MAKAGKKPGKFMQALAKNPAFAKKVAKAKGAAMPKKMSEKADGGRMGAAMKARMGAAMKDRMGAMMAQRKAAAPAMRAPMPMPPGGRPMAPSVMKKGGAVKKMAEGGTVSARADGIAKKGKTRAKMPIMRSGGAC